jgi:hypothetical protein
VAKKNRMPKKEPHKWHVFRNAMHFRVFSDQDVAEMDSQELAAYQPVQEGFDTEDAANRFMWSLRGRN